MTHEEKRLIEAAKRIKEHCKKSHCKDCIFGTGDSAFCEIRYGRPQYWNLKEEGENDE